MKKLLFLLLAAAACRGRVEVVPPTVTPATPIPKVSTVVPSLGRDISWRRTPTPKKSVPSKRKSLIISQLDGRTWHPDALPPPAKADALKLGDNTSPYGNPLGPHGVTYPCAGWVAGQYPAVGTCSGLHWAPCIPDAQGFGCGDSYDGPQVYSADPLLVMEGFRAFFPRGLSRYSAGGGFIPDYVFNAFEARRAEIDIGCVVPQPLDGNGRVGCTYPHAWWQFDSAEPPVQSILLQIMNVIASDPNFQIKCGETLPQWEGEFYSFPYFGLNVCSGVFTPIPTMTPSQTPTPGQATVTPFGPTATSTPASQATPTPACPVVIGQFGGCVYSCTLQQALGWTGINCNIPPVPTGVPTWTPTFAPVLTLTATPLGPTFTPTPLLSPIPPTPSPSTAPTPLPTPKPCSGCNCKGKATRADVLPTAAPLMLVFGVLFVARRRLKR